MLGFFDFFYNLMYRLGLWVKRANIVILGLDNAGKTSLMHQLQKGTEQMRFYPPTKRPSTEEIRFGNTILKAFDLGGHAPMRRIWSDYTVGSNAIVYLIDSADRNRFDESAEELLFLLEDENLKQIPMLLLANKCDLQRAARRHEIIDAFDLQSYLTDRPGPIELFEVSVLTQAGLESAFNWLISNIA